MTVPLASRAMSSDSIRIGIWDLPCVGRPGNPVPNQEPTAPVPAGRRQTASDAAPGLTCRNRLSQTLPDESGVHGMQKVRGSNPLSSTLFFACPFQEKEPNYRLLVM